MSKSRLVVTLICRLTGVASPLVSTSVGQTISATTLWAALLVTSQPAKMVNRVCQQMVKNFYKSKNYFLLIS